MQIQEVVPNSLQMLASHPYLNMIIGVQIKQLITYVTNIKNYNYPKNEREVKENA